MESRNKYKSYQNYYADVRNNLYQLNKKESLDEQAEYLSYLRKCDKEFIKFLNHNQDTKLKSVFFTRHGLCSYNQKSYGFAPNATVEETALGVIDKSASVAINMFSIEPNAKLCIAISPMIRARQTASKIIPDHLSDLIEIKNFLTENSSHPSGKPLLDVESLQSEDGLMFKISSTIYDQTYFDNLAGKLNQANQALLSKSITHSVIEDTNESFDFSDNEKIDLINLYINNKIHCADYDIWLIGHGKNTQNYFTIRYFIDDSLDYCETRKVIHYYDINGDASEFVTPYILKINQTTGMFTGHILPPEIKPIIMYTYPLQFLENYIEVRTREHNINIEKARVSNSVTLQNTSTFFKEEFNIDYISKTNSAKHMVLILKGLCLEPLTDAEIKTLDNARLGEGLKKYNIDIYAINDSLKKSKMNLSNQPI